MGLHLLAGALTPPALLFVILGLVGTQVKNDLEIPKTSSKCTSYSPLFIKAGKK